MVSVLTTRPSGSRNPATIRGTPGRKDWAHHLSSLNLKTKTTIEQGEGHVLNWKLNVHFFVLAYVCYDSDHGLQDIKTNGTQTHAAPMEASKLTGSNN